MTKKLTRNERITKANAAFDKLSPAQKRVAIATDVIDQLKKGKIVADHCYVESVGAPLLKGKADEDGMFLPDAKLSLNVPECRVCGIGSLFVCALKRADRLFGKDIISPRYGAESDDYELDRHQITGYLKRWFTNGQLNDIEAAFEEQHHATGWIGLMDDDTERMTAIMQNIIRNKGTFKIGQVPVQKWVYE